MIRFWASTTGRRLSGLYKPESWALLALSYLSKLDACRDPSGEKLPIKAISATGDVDLQEGSLWHPYKALFEARVGKTFVNVVVSSFGELLGRLHTAGMPNVAITGCLPRPLTDHALMALMKYDVVFAMDPLSQAYMLEKGVASELLDPRWPAGKIGEVLMAALGEKRALVLEADYEPEAASTWQAHNHGPVMVFPDGFEPGEADENG